MGKKAYSDLVKNDSGLGQLLNQAENGNWVKEGYSIYNPINGMEELHLFRNTNTGKIFNLKGEPKGSVR